MAVATCPSEGNERVTPAGVQKLLLEISKLLFTSSARHKKVRCNLSAIGAMSGNAESSGGHAENKLQVCTNCRQAGLTCTFTESSEKRGSSKSYVQQFGTRLGTPQEDSSRIPVDTLPPAGPLVSMNISSVDGLPLSHEYHRMHRSDNKWPKVIGGLPSVLYQQDHTIIPTAQSLVTHMHGRDISHSLSLSPLRSAAGPIRTCNSSKSSHAYASASPYNDPPILTASLPTSKLPPISCILSDVPIPLPWSSSNPPPPDGQRQAHMRKDHSAFSHRHVCHPRYSHCTEDQLPNRRNELRNTSPAFDLCSPCLEAPEQNYTSPGVSSLLTTSEEDRPHHIGAQTPSLSGSSVDVQEGRTSRLSSATSRSRDFSPGHVKPDQDLHTNQNFCNSTRSLSGRSTAPPSDSLKLRKALFATPAMRTFALLPPSMLEAGLGSSTILLRAASWLTRSTAGSEESATNFGNICWQSDINAIIGQSMQPFSFDHLWHERTCQELETLLLCYVDCFRRGQYIAGLLDCIAGKLSTLESTGWNVRRYRSSFAILSVWYVSLSNMYTEF